MNAEHLLKQLGFTQYEQHVYLALTSLGNATAAELAKKANIPKNKTYDVLEKLKHAGHVMELPTTPKKYKILSHDKLLTHLQEQEKNLIQLKKTAHEFISSIKTQTYEPGEKIWIIKGHYNTLNKIADQIQYSQKENLSAIVGSRGTMSPAFHNTKAAIKRGVTVKIIGTVNKDNIKKIEQWIKIGVEFRVYNETIGPIGTRFSTFDDSVCRITIGTPEVKTFDDYITIWAESKSLTSLLQQQFYTMWEQCIPWEEYVKQSHKNTKNKKIT